jgi:hypothetical protein
MPSFMKSHSIEDSRRHSTLLLTAAATAGDHSAPLLATAIALPGRIKNAVLLTAAYG